MSLRRSLALFAVCLAGCAGLSPAAQKIRISTKAETAKCRFLKVVYGGPGLTPKNDALENAARVQATHIVTLYDQDQKYTADAFDCNQQAATMVAAQQTQPVAQPVPAAPPAKRESAAWVIAVMDIENRAGEKDTFAKGLLQNVADQLRVFVAQKGLKTIDRGAQEKMIRDQIEQAKQDSYKSCYESSCQVELGKALAASHILRAQITRFGKSCVLNAELIDLKAEVTISATSSKGTCEEEGFLEMSEKVAAGLTGP